MYTSGGYYSGMLRYVKKEDAVEYVKSQYKMAGWMLIVLPTIFSVIQIIIAFSTTWGKLNLGLLFEIGVFLLSIIFSVIILTTKKDYSLLEIKLKNYKDGEMINVKDLRSWTNNSQMIWTLIILFLIVIATVVGLTSQI